MFKKSTLNIRGSLYQLDKPKVMGILNITPDSFYDGGKYSTIDSQLHRIEQMLREGADFIDIGAQSSRPGAKEIGAKNELKLLEPSIASIKKRFPEAIISIDTWYAKVAISAHNLGADIINDISGGTFCDDMFDTIKDIQIPYILMHTGGKPSNMQDNPQYDNILKEVIFFMSKQIDKLNHIGINDIIIDPGFGFGKTLEHNFELLKNLNHFSFLDAPLLIGISRKSMIYNTLNINTKDSLNGTTALHFKALDGGANILRVHDVKEAKECINLHQQLTNT